MLTANEDYQMSMELSMRIYEPVLIVEDCFILWLRQQKDFSSSSHTMLASLGSRSNMLFAAVGVEKLKSREYTHIIRLNNCKPHHNIVT